jgi:hypothetical protein
MQTIESLLSGPATGGGRRRDDIAQTKLSVIDLAWNLFEELGVETSVNDTGSLTLFVRAIFSDPGLSFLGGMPVDMRPLLREVRDSRPSQPNTGGANSLNYHPC